MNIKESQPKREFGKTRRRLLFAAVIVWILGPFAYWGVSEIDHQFGNFTALGFALLGGLLATTAAISWISWRWSVTIVAMLVGGGLFASFQLEFKGFTGELIPTFAWRKAPQSSNEKSLTESFDKFVDPTLVTQVASSFSTQFFGNSRNGIVQSPEFSTRWEEQPPKILWKRPIGQGWAGTAVSQQRIYTLYQADQDETIAALDLLTGQTVWETKLPGYHTHTLGGTGPRSTPAIFKDVLVSQTASGQLVVCRLDSGDLVWKEDLIALGGWTLVESESAIPWGRSGSPLIADRNGKPTVIIPLGGSKANLDPISLAAFDLETGELVWRTGRDQIAYGSPVALNIRGVDHIAVIQEDFAVGYAIDDGRELWRSEWPSKTGADACASQPVLVGENRILLGKGYAQGCKLIEIDTEFGSGSEGPVWSVKTVWDHKSLLKTKFTSAIYHRDRLFGLSDGVLECVDAKTGRRVWKKGRFGQGQLLVVNDQLLVTAEDGRVALVDSEQGDLRYELTVLEGITWNIPTIAGPFLIVRNGDEIACLYSPQSILSGQQESRASTGLTE